MKQLETIIQSKGFTYEIIERSEFNAIQSQKDGVSGELIAYEVFRIKKNPDRVLHGVKMAASESRPNDNAFGVSAWCYAVFSSDGANALVKARTKFAELEAAQAERERAEREKNLAA